MVTYNLNIPAGPNNPSNDQPKMQTNTNAIQTLISVDHVGFNTNGTPPNGVGGHHLQVSFDGKNVPGVQTDPQSVLYTNSGVASTVSEVFFRNQNRIFQMSVIKAWAFSLNATAAPPTQSFNVTSVTKIALGRYDVVLTAGAVTSANFGVLVSAQSGTSLGFTSSYSITGVGTFTLFFGFPVLLDPQNFTFTVYQI